MQKRNSGLVNQIFFIPLISNLTQLPVKNGHYRAQRSHNILARRNPAQTARYLAQNVLVARHKTLLELVHAMPTGYGNLGRFTGHTQQLQAARNVLDARDQVQQVTCLVLVATDGELLFKQKVSYQIPVAELHCKK